MVEVARAPRSADDGNHIDAVLLSAEVSGPLPATTDSRFTSVGSRAIDRWVRPIAFQDAPRGLLPEVLRDGNPTGSWRQVDGAWPREGIR